MRADLPFPLRGRRVWVAGHRGLLGSALMRRLAREDCDLLAADRRTLDLRDPAAVRQWLRRNRPDAVFLAAATVGGILANRDRPADFLFDNLMIAANVVDAAWLAGVSKLMLIGSSCIYPRDAAQPMREGALMSGPLEPTNAPYAQAKLAALALGEAYRRQHGFDAIGVLPTNLYGPGDRYDLSSSHVLPALVRKAWEARRAGADRLVVWGTGAPRREFLHADDCADALVLLMQRWSDAAPVNVGSGDDVSIAELARMAAEATGFAGEIAFDPSFPDGAPVKRLDVSTLAGLGWRPAIPLPEGMRAVAQAYMAAHPAAGPDLSAPLSAAA